MLSIDFFLFPDIEIRQIEELPKLQNGHIKVEGKVFQ